MERKQSAEAHGLFRDLIEEFKEYFKHVRSLRSDEKPNYVYLRTLFRNVFSRKGYEYNYIFDWIELKFLEHIERSRNDPRTANARLT